MLNLKIYCFFFKEIIDRIIDLSKYDNAEETLIGKAPEYITKDKVKKNFNINLI